MIEFECLLEAYLECRRNKRYSAAALAFEINMEENLLLLWRQINDGTYTVSPAIAFVVEYPVKREVFAADFRDRVVHHLLMKKLMPPFEKEFIYDNYACRPQKGTLFGIRRLRRFIAQCSQGYTRDCYILKCDISGFFMNIDRRELWFMLEKFIQSHEVENKDIVLKLTKQVVMHDPTIGCHINGSVNRWRGVPTDKSLFGTNGKAMPGEKQPRQLAFDFCPEKGLPIGNLTSQWFGNFYLNALDHYVKGELGVRYYGRYVDDFVLVHEDKEFLKELIPRLETYLKQKLQLTLHPRKRYLQHYSKGVTFLGVKIKKAALLTGKRTKSRLHARVEKWNTLSFRRLLTSNELGAFRNSVNSYWGIMRHYNSYRLRRKCARRFSAQIENRVLYPGFAKIKLNDFIVMGKDVFPYFEFDKLKKKKRK